MISSKMLCIIIIIIVIIFSVYVYVCLCVRERERWGGHMCLSGGQKNDFVEFIFPSIFIWVSGIEIIYFQLFQSACAFMTK